jgi:hypothetical protein
MVLIIRSWASSSKDSLNVELGVVSMNSTELSLKYFLSLPNKYKVSNMLLIKVLKDLSSKNLKSE